MVIVALVIAFSACVSLSIREASKKAKEELISTMTVTAQLSYDCSSVMSQMRESGDFGGFDRSKFDGNALSGMMLTLDDYMKYTKLLSDAIPTITS